MIIIIGILAAIAIPMFLNQREKAKDAAVKEGVHAIADRHRELGAWTTTPTTPTPATSASGVVDGRRRRHAIVAPWPTDPYDAEAPMSMAAGGSTTTAYVASVNDVHVARLGAASVIIGFPERSSVAAARGRQRSGLRCEQSRA